MTDTQGVLASLFVAVGALAVIVGVAVIYEPLGVIVAGVVAMGVGVGLFRSETGEGGS